MSSMTPTNRHGLGRGRRLIRLATALIAVVALAAACSSDSDDADMGGDRVADTAHDGLGEPGDDADFAPHEEGEAEAPVAPDDMGERGDEAADGGAGGAPADMSATVLASVDLGRSIIYTATLDIEVDDVSAASRQAQQAVAAVGGLVFSQETTSDPRPRTTLVFRVPPDDFGEAMDRLEGVGTVVDQSITADDVTDRVVDLQSRITTAEVSVERLRSLLAEAASVEAVASLENQLLDRETNLEQLRGQLRTIQSQVSLATITVTITEEAPPTPEPEIAVATTAYVGDDDGDRCPGERRLDADEGESIVLCVAVENTGNVDLTDIEVRDLSLDLRREDFTLIDFGDDDVLEPDETVIAWARFDASPGDTPRPNVTAVPVDDEGDPIRQTMAISEDPLALDVVEDDSLPGLGDSLATGWGGLQQVFGVAIVVIGTVAPFAIVAAVPAGLYLWWRRRDEEDATDEEPTSAPATT